MSEISPSQRAITRTLLVSTVGAIVVLFFDNDINSWLLATALSILMVYTVWIAVRSLLTLWDSSEGLAYGIDGQRADSAMMGVIGGPRGKIYLRLVFVATKGVACGYMLYKGGIMLPFGLVMGLSAIYLLWPKTKFVP